MARLCEVSEALANTSEQFWGASPLPALNVRDESAYHTPMAWAFRSVVAAAGLLLSCAGSLADPPVSTDDSGGVPESPRDVTAPAGSPKHDPSGAAVIATLRTRDSELTILSEGGSMRYALVDADGETKSLTLDELRAYDSNLFEVVKSATARRGSAGAPFVDARVDRPASSNAPGAPPAVIPVRADRNGGRFGAGMPLRD
jgi:hypothetical protein